MKWKKRIETNEWMNERIYYDFSPFKYFLFLTVLYEATNLKYSEMKMKLVKTFYALISYYLFLNPVLLKPGISRKITFFLSSLSLFLKSYILHL